MTTPISGLSAALPAGAGRPPEPAAARSDPFAQLLNMQMDWPTLDAGQSDQDPTNLYGAAETSGLADTAGPLLTYTLLQLLDRLITTQASPAQTTPQGLPVAGPVSQSAHAGHQAMDLAVPVGTPVRATMDGQVAFAGWNTEGYGNLVIVENGAYRTYYAHLDSLPVAAGQQVTAGQIVGLSGNTGNSTGPHVHYEVRLNGTPIDPGLSA